MLRRLVFRENWETSFTVEDERDGKETDWHYLRVFESNGERGWSSPVWV